MSWLLAYFLFDVGAPIVVKPIERVKLGVPGDLKKMKVQVK